MNDDELRRLLEEGTPRPWMSGRGGRAVRNYFNGYLAEWHSPPDADIIVTAVNALPELLDAAEALERVKALHQPTPASTSMHYHCEPSECDQAGDGELRDECDNCREWYPCSTIRTIEGTDHATREALQ